MLETMTTKLERILEDVKDVLDARAQLVPIKGYVAEYDAQAVVDNLVTHITGEKDRYAKDPAISLPEVMIAAGRYNHVLTTIEQLKQEHSLQPAVIPEQINTKELIGKMSQCDVMTVDGHVITYAGWVEEAKAWSLLTADDHVFWVIPDQDIVALNAAVDHFEFRLNNGSYVKVLCQVQRPYRMAEILAKEGSLNPYPED